MTPLAPLDRASTVFVAGHGGLVGSSIWRHLTKSGFTRLIGRSSSELDLRDRRAVFNFMSRERPAVVIDAAARVGGIRANDLYSADFLSENLQIQVNLMDAANFVDVERLLFLGSSCIYPKFAPQPIRETALLTGPLEPTNDSYAIAKIAGLMQVQAYRKQYGRRWISAMPTNLYGPGDNFHPENSHVLPALIRKFHHAVISESREVTIWGSGTPRREFLYVDDLAEACLFLLDNYDEPDTVNIGVGHDMTIQDVAEIVANAVGFTGTIGNDPLMPDGTPQKLLDVSRLSGLGWRAKTTLPEGIAATYTWYLSHLASLRSR